MISLSETEELTFTSKDRNIGLAFENYALYPPLTVYENIAFSLRAKVYPTQVDERVKEIAPLLKVEELLNMRPAALSEVETACKHCTCHSKKPDIL